MNVCVYMYVMCKTYEYEYLCDILYKYLYSVLNSGSLSDYADHPCGDLIFLFL